MLFRGQFFHNAFVAALAALNLPLAASSLVSVNASAPAPVPQVGPLHMGSSTAGIAPNGDTLSVNNQSLVRNGQPWVPVAGEFHYSRYPAEQWLPELLKMKAAGVDVVSTYVIWIFHEEVQNQTLWSERYNVTRFVETAAEAGLSVIARIGPWVHAETRNGGIPDWVIEQSDKVRSNDPKYLAFVKTFWTDLAGRMTGSLFKNGGPIIGLQIENEYSATGSGQGAAHIATLKALAISLGFDLPLYTFTGWQNTQYPPYEFVPVFGGYQDQPWDTILTDEPPSETYSFRFFSECSPCISSTIMGMDWNVSKWKSMLISALPNA